MISAASRVTTLLASLGLACKPVATQLPTWDPPAPEAPVAGAAAEPPAVPGTGGDAVGVAHRAPGDGGSKPVGGGAPEPGGGDASAAEPASVSVAEPLPKAAHTKVDASCGHDPGLGGRVKPFKLKTADGQPVSPAHYRNKVLLLNFWGTWCAPCKEELPEFDKLYKRYRKHGLALVAVATDADGAAVTEFAQSRKLAAKLAVGGEDVAGAYASNKFPFSFLVDGKGVIKASYRGYRPECLGKVEADIRAELEKLAR